MTYRQALVRWACCAVLLISMIGATIDGASADQRAEEMVTAAEIGLIDDVHIYDRPLSREEAKVLATADDVTELSQLDRSMPIECFCHDR